MNIYMYTHTYILYESFIYVHIDEWYAGATS